MPLPVPSYTIEDLDRFPQDGNRYELLDGMVLVTPTPRFAHQVVCQRLASMLSGHLEQADRARVVTPGAVEILPKTHLEPDVLVVPAEFALTSQWHEISGWWLACEVLSRRSVLYDRGPG